ncbi:Type IV pilus biogenesis protein PilE [Psychrobacter sp. JB385]|nr:Type IV pilus biogenesis protein PilE [Psychrobacter sp. JB385]
MMMTSIDKNMNQGFTLIELLIVVAIIGILAAIAYPSYLGYIEKGMRTDMMGEMHSIASTIESRKLAQGKYNSIVTTDLSGAYPKQGEAQYTVSIRPNPLTSQWTIEAKPKSNTRMKNDGTLTLDYQGIKCRNKNTDKKCGSGDEWK